MGDGPYTRISIYMPKSEYEKFIAGYNTTIYRSKNAYARKLLLGKPITMVYRNRSLDDFTESAIRLRKDLRVFLCKDAFTSTEKEYLAHQMASIEKYLIKIVDLCTQ